MPDIVIKYKSRKTLEALMDFAKYFEYSVVMPKPKIKSRKTNINGATIIQADNTIDTSDLEPIFTNRNIDSKQLRKVAWQRNK